MKVRLNRINNGDELIDLTIGKIYDVTEIDRDGDAWIIDDVGDVNNLYVGEFEEVVDAE